MSNEAQLYSFIEKYLMGRGIEIIQNEVSFRKQLKVLDLLAKKYDSSIYYLIEVKKGEILNEDYYNLKYIIENNNIGRRKLGMLMGDCGNEELRQLIEKDPCVELIEINQILKVENMNNNRNINYHKSCYNPYKKYFTNLFKYISDDTLYDFSITDDHLIKIKYKIDEHEYLTFKGYIDRWQEIKGSIYVDTMEYYFREKVSSEIERDINIKNLREVLYKIKYSNIFKNNDIDEFFKYVNFKYVYSILDTLSNIVDLEEVRFTKKDSNILEIVDCSLVILKTNSNKALLFTSDLADFLIDQYEYSKNDNYYICLDEVCRKSEFNDELNFLEFTNVILKNELIEPLKTIEEYDFKHYKITIEVKLKDNKKLKKSYKVRKIKNIKLVDFYLFANWDIMINFQRELNKVVGKSVDIIYERDYIKNHRWNRIKDYIGKVNTNRIIIEKFIDNELGGDTHAKDIFERSIWGFDENGRYNEL